MGWWTRTQRIRTVAEIPFGAALLEMAQRPAYQRIARKALQLQQLGVSLSAIGRRLGVTDKTTAKAIRWLRQLQARPEESQDSS